MLQLSQDLKPDRQIAIALGGGGARGLAHIVAIEALDELGVRPSQIIGTSMGAIIGAAYAAGVPGAALRTHALAALKDRTKVLARLLEARVGKMSDLFVRGLGNPVLVDGEKVLDLFWPEAVPDLFADLAIPFSAVAADYYARCEAVFDRGSLVTGVAASMAIPGLVRPVLANGRVYVDGGIVNPLPFDLLPDDALVIAVDVTGGPASEGTEAPEPFEALLGAAQIMQGAIVEQKLRARRPAVLVRPRVGGFHALDFFRGKAILQAAEPIREELKRAIAAALAGEVSAAR